MNARIRLGLWVAFYVLLIAGLIASGPAYVAHDCHTSGRVTICRK